MNDHIPVILNPAARSARAGERLEMIRALSPQVEIHATNGAGDARRMARELAAAGARIVVAAGGDGTVNEVTNGLADAGPSSTAALGILPNGTMNVFANDLGLPAHRMDECWAIIASGRVREIDLWKANDTHFAQLAGVGFDAAVIGNVTWESKKRLGPLSYVKSLLELLKRGSPELTITVDGRAPMIGRVVLIGNGRHYGGPFRLFTQSSFDDGLMDVVVMETHGFADVLRLTRAAVTGSYAGIKGLTYLQTKELHVTAAEPMAMQTDGELAGVTPVHFRHAGFPLRVVTA